MADVVRRLGIPPALERVFLLNGRGADGARPLGAGDMLEISPPLSRGAGWLRKLG